jgi:hypothetical protein
MGIPDWLGSLGVQTKFQSIPFRQSGTRRRRWTRQTNVHFATSVFCRKLNEGGRGAMDAVVAPSRIQLTVVDLLKTRTSICGACCNQRWFWCICGV